MDREAQNIYSIYESASEVERYKKHIFPGGATAVEVYRDENGEYHRDGGPAIITATAESWYTHGKLNRLDGPAHVSSAGGELYWINNKQYPKKQFDNIITMLQKFPPEDRQKALDALDV